MQLTSANHVAVELHEVPPAFHPPPIAIKLSTKLVYNRFNIWFALALVGVVHHLPLWIDDMKLWFISDTHGQHELLNIPENVDAVLHCGDESESGNAWLNEPEARKFFTWYSSLDIPTKIFVPGNHSTAIEQGLIRASEYPAIKFLIHDQVTWQSLKIFGSPYTPMFFDWAYMKERSELDAVWQTIPDDIDILITHGPPKGILDVTKDMDTRQPVHVGSKSLTRHVETRIKPKIHAFGHIHDERGINNFGTVTRGDTQFINCSCCDLGGRLKNQGFMIEIKQQIESAS